MPQFSRRTILAATDLLPDYGHSALTRFLLDYGLDEVADAGNLRDRANAIARFLVKHPEANDDEGRNLTDSLVEKLIRDDMLRFHGFDGFQFDRFVLLRPNLHRALERDGFTIEDGELRRTLPKALDLPNADDEVHRLLANYRYQVPEGHLDQAIGAHARGDWAAANGQLRSFAESLFDCIAETLATPGVVPPSGHQSRLWLAHSNPPFFYSDLNEWLDNGQGYFEAYFRRLHPQGAHPGLSDEEDSTFRLHLVLLTARLLLRRLVGLRP
jgi:hypothetical protein